MSTQRDMAARILLENLKHAGTRQGRHRIRIGLNKLHQIAIGMSPDIRRPRPRRKARPKK
jgi:hypothetical protein